jgi:ligand-binding sensor protein
MELTDLMPLADWEQIENEVHRRWGIDANFFNTDGIRITSFKAWANRLCPEIKANDKGQSFICAVAHMSLAAQAKNSREPQIEECDGGLVKIVVPIIVDDVFVGAFGACGFLLEDGEVDTFLVNKVTDIDEDRLAALSEGIPRIRLDTARALVAFVQKALDGVLHQAPSNQP